MSSEILKEAEGKKIEDNDAGVAQSLSDDPFSIASSPDTAPSSLLGSAALSRVTTSTTISDGTAALDEADRKLQSVLATEGLTDDEEPSVKPRADPYEHFQCEFGWTGGVIARGKSGYLRGSS